MKKLIFSTIGIAAVTLFTSSIVFAQGMMGNTGTVSDGHTAREEAEGKAVWEKLQAKTLACKDLSDDNFGTLGEYFMGTMMGTSHEAMNDRLKQAFGDAGESQMHVALGQRMSGCDTSAAYPMGFSGFMPIMGEQSSPGGINATNNSMMNLSLNGYGGMMGGFGTLGFITWLVVIIDLVLLGIWLWKKISNK